MQFAFIGDQAFFVIIKNDVHVLPGAVLDLLGKDQGIRLADHFNLYISDVGFFQTIYSCF